MFVTAGLTGSAADLHPAWPRHQWRLSGRGTVVGRMPTEPR